MAGMAFTCASLGLIHSLAHKIGGEFGITHGLANAILLPYIVQFNSKATDKVEWIEKELGVKNFPEAIKELNKKLNIPLNLKDVDEVEISEAKFNEVLDRMSKNAYEDPCTLTNPRQSSPEIVKMIYVHAFEGKDITE
jgi:NADPH-dependent butanol dehydrogenase